MTTRGLLGFAAVACAACCIGPIVAALGAVAALGLAASLLIGVAGVIVAGAAVAAIIVVKRRRRTCRAVPESVNVELTRASR